MIARLRETNTGQFLRIAAILLGLTALLIIVLRFILAGYETPWTGFGEYALSAGGSVRAKTLWDWMDLLIIPFFLAGGAFYLERSERTVERKASAKRENIERQAAEDRAKLEREIAADRQQEVALQSYIDRMAELLLNEKLQAHPSEESSKLMRVRTLTVLRGLNAARNRIVVRFLRDIELVGKQESTLFLDANLEGADLAGVNLGETRLDNAHLEDANLERAVFIKANLFRAILTDANLKRALLNAANFERAVLKNANLQSASLFHASLRNANLQGANLQDANLLDADLQNAVLEGANLQGANLQGANLQGASLREANLAGAQVSAEQLITVRSLQGSIMAHRMEQVSA